MTEISVDQLRDSFVYDLAGAELGKVESIFLDVETDEPSFVSVKMGSRDAESVIPVASARLEGDKIRVAYGIDAINRTPSVDTSEGLQPSDEDKIREHYSASEVEVEEEGAMIRRAERLAVGTKSEKAGQARLNKRVVTKTKTAEVPVEREELVIEREALSDEEAQQGGGFSEEEQVINLHKESPVVEKKVVGVEKVNVGKRTVSETKTVSADVQEEQIDIDSEGAAQGEGR